MTTQKPKKIPGPLYAAAGAGDLAYQKLRTLPGQVAHLRGKMADLRPAAGGKVRRPDLERLRGSARRNADALAHSARRNADALAHGAHVAQDRAAAVYADLVTRGEQVVHTAQSSEDGSATIVEPKPAVDAAAAPTAEIVAEPEPAKPTATTKPAAKSAAKRAKPAAE
ncbi:MAG: hypothetical protein HKP61_12475 [Dactylosporangium sp.]|nr:hypothetical protein [Dactylosporangium sp.]NNJ61735.1 hypothetical protein [Dactylosporangium sp.]